jgi:ABC-type glycerol-3-phosphate transport system substrate-binding protein
MMKRTLAIILPVMLLVALVSSAALAQVTVRVVGWGGYENIINDWLSDFDDPNINLEISEIPTWGNSYYERLTLMLATSPEPPDIFVVEPEAALTAFSNLLALDLSTFIAKEMDDFSYVDGWKGLQLGLVHQRHGLNPWGYKKEHILEAGLEEPVELALAGEWDNDTLLDYFSTLYTYDDEGHVITAAWEASSPWFTFVHMPYLYNHGARATTPEGNEIIWASDEGVAAYEFMKRMQDAGAMPFRHNYPDHREWDGLATFACSPRKNITGDADFHCDTVHPPEGPAGIKNGGTIQPWIISSKTENPNEAWKVLTALVDACGDRATCNGSRARHLGPFMENQLGYNTKHPEYIWTKVFEAWTFRTRTHEGGQVGPILAEAARQVLEGEVPVRTGLEEGQRQANAILASYR